jgi:sulfur-oxidizing protein SoxZ
MTTISPIRIRARLRDGLTEVHVLMPHPMETGFRREAADQPVAAAHYITDMRVSVAGRDVLAARLSVAVSADPLLTFRFRNAQAGDRIAVTWTDNLGGQRTDESLIT